MNYEFSILCGSSMFVVVSLFEIQLPVPGFVVFVFFSCEVDQRHVRKIFKVPNGIAQIRGLNCLPIGGSKSLG
jgi:hypothetical protein